MLYATVTHPSGIYSTSIKAIIEKFLFSFLIAFILIEEKKRKLNKIFCKFPIVDRDETQNENKFWVWATKFVHEVKRRISLQKFCNFVMG